MTQYTAIDIPTSADDFAASVYDAVQSRYPEWTPSDANLETWLIDAFARLAAEIASLSAATSLAIFRKFGETIIGVPPLLATRAEVNSTWTMKDNAGYTISAGTEVTIAKTGDERYGFEVVSNVVVPPGSTTTAAGAVLLRALVEGEDANDLGVASPVSILTATDALFGATAVVSGTSSGGRNEETEQEYVDRLVEELQLLTLSPILVTDFARIIKRHAGVDRAMVLNLWNGAEPGVFTVGRGVGWVAIDAAGADISAPMKTAIQADLQSRMLFNSVAAPGAPTFTNIFVTAVVRCYEGFDTAAVDAAVTAAIQSYLSPANWGRPSGVGDPGSSFGDWINSKTVRRGELWSLCDRIDGVNYIETLTLGTATAPAGTADIALTGNVPLTRPAVTGTGISVTANAGP